MSFFLISIFDVPVAFLWNTCFCEALYNVGSMILSMKYNITVFPVIPIKKRYFQ